MSILEMLKKISEAKRKSIVEINTTLEDTKEVQKEENEQEQRDTD